MGMNMVQLDNGNFIVQSHVGQVIMSTTLDTEDKVKQYYGGTSWTKIEGKFLIGASSSYGVGTTGGAASASYTPAGSVNATTLTINQIPSHGHNVRAYHKDAGTTDYLKTYQSNGTSFNTQQYGIALKTSYIQAWSNTTKSAGSGLGDQAGTTDTKGGGGSHNHGFSGTKATINTTPPYYAVYIWVRTA